MKKIIKIFALILFIIFVFGITTSKAALEVNGSTTAEEMIGWLNQTTEGSDGFLTGISNDIRIKNPSLYCRQRGTNISALGKYHLDSSVIPNPKIYPYYDENSKGYEGYVQAYIFGADGYGDNTTNGLRQWAYWQSLGQETGENDLLKIAKAYQNYKKSEKKVEVNYDNAEISTNNNEVIYGPIKIIYSYTGIKAGNYSDSWGGFDYTFLSDKGTITSGITLCTLNANGIYKDIKSTINTDNYYEVRTIDYNNEELYVKINLETLDDIDKLSIKIKENTVDYTAKVYDVKAEYEVTSRAYVYCSVCEGKLDGAVFPEELPQDQTGNVGKLIKLKINYDYTDKLGNSKTGSYFKYYVCTGSGSESQLFDTHPGNTYLYYVYIDGNRKVITKNTAMGITPVYVCGCKKICVGLEGAKSHGKEHYSYETGYDFICHRCNFSTEDESEMVEHQVNNHFKKQYHRSVAFYNFSAFNGCGCVEIVQENTIRESQQLSIIESTKKTFSNEIQAEIDIPISASIEITKKWTDYDNEYNLRPETLKFNIFRSTDKTTWEKLSENTDYKLEIESKEGSTWIISITGLERKDDNGNEYFFKVEEQELVCYQASYPEGKEPTYNEETGKWYIDIDNSLKNIDFSGYVWLDGQEGIKPATSPDGNCDWDEPTFQGINVYLYYKNPETGVVSKIAETKTDATGHYKFEKCEIGYYYVEFEYDGINYEDTIEGGDSNAFDVDRDVFNNRFKTITYGKSNDGTILNYNYSSNKSTLITTDENGIMDNFIMKAKSEQKLYTSNMNYIDLGLVKRGTDIALSTYVKDAIVTINGQTTKYKYKDNTIEFENGYTSENDSDNSLYLHEADYNYRIKDYKSNTIFKESDFANETIPGGTTTGDELKVYVTYEIELKNQSTKPVRINEVKYTYDSKYTFIGFTDSSYNDKVQKNGNDLIINLNGLELTEGATKTLYLVFEVNKNDRLEYGEFFNHAEITSYSTDEGLIDVDSEPGNSKDNKHEDDCDGCKLNIVKSPMDVSTLRKITGKVFDKNNTNVNDVIVQLIELKTVNGKVYEYIWQETVSGTGKGLRVKSAGTDLEEYTYTKSDGTYEFNGFIPGEYIVRFIYGDGTTYDMTENVIKYNGQDYKSVSDKNYKEEWYNSSIYDQGASVARDNEARRLETMAYSVEIDAEKGVLLKLLNNVTVDVLNKTEKEILIAAYNNLYDPDITEVSTEVINKLLKEQVLKKTWMCAETSKIKVAVDTDTENINNTDKIIAVDGKNNNYVKKISNINLGLELRPATEIELKKYITGFKLTAANGQTLVNATIDVNEYLNGTTDISNKVQGIKDNVTILDTVWQYEVAPIDIQTLVDGASLEFIYTLVVKNTGEKDYLSKELAEAYNTTSITEYIETLGNKSNEMKDSMRTGTYRTQIGKHVGNSYYTGETGSNEVKTEVTNIRDYVNNDLSFVAAYEGKVEIDEENSPMYHRTLRDDYSMQNTEINTILRTTESTGKMGNTDIAKMYVVTLGKNPISSTGNLNFENYIAEVMSYTNAAGRRSMTSTPGNAEIIDHEHREGKAHEIDEADTARIQIGAATGADEKTNYIIITAVIAGILIIATGVFAVKKYVIK